MDAICLQMQMVRNAALFQWIRIYYWKVNI